jgi:uncharacterized membrane protein YeaQ/YmgE (transglycosylase-associated protein family)
MSAISDPGESQPVASEIAAAPPPTGPEPLPVDPPGKADQLRLIAGLLALSAGLIALLVVVIVALITKPDTTGGAIATSAIGVIGSIVGAYFGVKIGSDGTKSAIEAQQKEATKAQVFALHTPSEQADAVVSQTERLMRSFPSSK